VRVLGDDGQAVEAGGLPAELIRAKRLLAEGEAKEAQEAAQEWLEENEGAAYADQAYWVIAQGLYDRGRYYQAFEKYEELLDGSPGTELFEASLRQEMEIGQLFLAGKKRLVWGFIPASAKTEGLEILDRVIDRWPGSEMAAEALMIQAEHYFAGGRFVEAQSTYQVLVESYSKSRFYQDALLRNAEATHGQYAGPGYDASCLTDARIRYEQYRARFPGHAGEIGIGPRIARIDWQLAQKHWVIADFYERTGRQGAARYYYEYVMSHWPDTEWAVRAGQRYAEPASDGQRIDNPEGAGLEPGKGGGG
jgi:tetratricopeptide (TPR) repeat protein